ncbi:phosphoglycerate dehydrogenase-like enzyme [Streptomyces sp. V4I23]|uniref:hydroxyacid dehydrogenase n=1 Tax=Streptomyces sp. V4I23 TaxID=3042282 RepID=UPI0027877A0E|nr:hydroxyacid dehydrogenase [Streptomyces sp. V4I23]MDQ1007072.1 phosphoglycerate dehydrogenase-like enzyme [Streptomyces sp. V4I23]
MDRPHICVAVAREEFDLLFSPASQQGLHDLAEIRFGAGPHGSTLPPGMADSCDAVVTSWSTVPFRPEEVRGGRLGLAVHSAGSVRRLYPRELLSRGLRLTQGGAAAMAPAVAEMALTLTLALLRNLHHHDRGLWAGGGWADARRPALGQALSERRVGLVGLSRTGTCYARMVKALGTSVVRAYDPYADPEAAAALGVETVGLDELFGSCDVIAVHAPATRETRHLVGGRQLAMLPDGGVLVNTARSWVVDQEALLSEVVAGRLRAGLDVFDSEPLPSSSPFLGLPNVIVTPHVAGGTVEARRAQGRTVVDELTRFFAGEPLAHEVLPETYDLLA